MIKKVQTPLNIKKIQTFVKMTPPSRSAAKSKIKGMLNAKTTAPSLPALACAISLPLREPVNPPPPSKADFLEVEVKNMIAEVMLDPAAAEDRYVSSLQSFFQFATAAAGHPGSEEGTVKLLAAEVAKHWPVVLKDLGEPRALAVYSSMSGILQKVSARDTFGDEGCIKTYVAALFYVAWELAGSAESNGPSVMRSAPKADVMRAAFRWIDYLSN